MRLPRVSDLPSTRIQVGISGTKDAYSSNFDATFGARLCGLCMKFGACPRRYEPPEAGDRACVGSYEPNEAAGARTFSFDLTNAPEARPGVVVGRLEDDGLKVCARVTGDRVRVWVEDDDTAPAPIPPAAAPGEGH